MNFDLHPQIVHFPIVLITVSFILQLIKVVKRTDNLLWQPFLFALSGLITGFAAAFSGQRAESTLSDVNPIVHEAIERHELFANLTVWILLPLIISWGYYSGKMKSARKFEIAILIALTFLTGIVLITGHLGGKLVYIYGVGISLP